MNELLLRETLQALKQCEPYYMREKTLRTQVNLSLPEPVGNERFDHHILFLAKKKLVEFRDAGALSNEREWRITEQGKWEVE